MTRREGETILVNGGELKIEVVEIQGKSVRLALVSSKDVRIERGILQITSCNDASEE